MNCEECLSELATGSLRDLRPDSAVMQHCATCPDCSQLTTLLREREYDAANVLNNLPPMSSPIAVAETSVRTAKRRRTGQIVVMLSGAALAITIWIVAATIVIPRMEQGDGIAHSTVRTETIPLTCLSPQQAADIIGPYISSRGSIIDAPTSGLSFITVRGNNVELNKSRELIRNFENDPAAACRHTLSADVKKLQDKAIKQALGAFDAGAGAASDKTPTKPKKP